MALYKFRIIIIIIIITIWLVSDLKKDHKLTQKVTGVKTNHCIFSFLKWYTTLKSQRRATVPCVSYDTFMWW